MKKVKAPLLLLVVVMLASAFMIVGCGGSSASNEPVKRADWEVLLDDLEKWIDKGCASLDKLEANPADTEAMAEVSAFTKEAAQWNEKTDAYKKTLSGEDYEAYTKRLKGLLPKLEVAVDKINKINSSKNNSSSTTPSESSDWEAFLDEYEAWVDSYAAFMEKYLKNPSDLSLLSDYSKMTSDMTTWAAKADEFKETLTPEESAKYLERLNAITMKLNSVVQSMF